MRMCADFVLSFIGSTVYLGKILEKLLDIKSKSFFRSSEEGHLIYWRLEEGHLLPKSLLNSSPNYTVGVLKYVTKILTACTVSGLSQ